MKQIKGLKKKEIVLVAAVVCAALFLLLLHPQTPGMVAVVSYRNEEIERIPLDRDGLYSIEADLPVTLEVTEGRIRFIRSQCPDKTCEGFGLIGSEFEYAICLPAGVAVQIESKG